MIRFHLRYIHILSIQTPTQCDPIVTCSSLFSLNRPFRRHIIFRFASHLNGTFYIVVLQHCFASPPHVSLLRSAAPLFAFFAAMPLTIIIPDNSTIYIY